MTSTNTFQGMDSCSKPSSRVLRPPGGGSSNLFGGDESPASPVKANKMASNIFVATEEPQSGAKRTNPPGGKSSGIFSEGQTPVSRPTAPSTSNIFVDSPSNPPSTRSHPNKPKDNIGINALPGPEVPKERNTPPRSAPGKEDTAPSAKELADQSSPQQNADNHEPRLGPKPRSHNKVIHPPGGKSSVVFY
ncbi:jupiter microtubule associated homolog 2 [Paramormyrops kingsleyae]|uniref:Jupiter microtubule associated homolog 2 n=1 Tax=Paramormyrops kingsleyae TaxID=1676925 RepID=A0A3B3S7T9_9TELE|nr:jupiter microtubule associated homolog 2 [Paramormyrops kingsleyae]